MSAIMTSRQRISKSEAMLTRHKSSLLKRQLRSKVRNKKKQPETVTCDGVLLQSTASKTSKSPKTHQIKTSKSHQIKTPRKLKMPCPKTQEDILDEFCPDKLKRSIKTKKVFLNPKLQMKVIGNKRKLGLPRKGQRELMFPELLKEDPCTDLTIQELINLTEDQSLDDEDFLEILTCESPVWWEDPPDDYYIEDAICTRFPDEMSEASVAKICQRDDLNTVNTITIPENKQCDDRFMKKRIKLENLLGNIRIKNMPRQMDSERHCVQEKTRIEKNNISKCNENAQVVGTQAGQSFIDVDIAENIQNEDEQVTDCTSADEDLFFNFESDDAHKTLESMYIPISNNSTVMNDIIIIEDSQDEMDEFCNNKSGIDMSNLPASMGEESELNCNAPILSDTCDTTLTTITGEHVKKYYLDEYTSSSKFSEKSNQMNIRPSFLITSIEKDSSPSPITIKSEDSMDVISLTSDSENLETNSHTNIDFVLEDTVGPEETNKFSDRSEESNTENENDFLTEALNLRKCNTSLIKNTREKVNKEQLMIVYKVITDDDYKDKHNTKNKSECGNSIQNKSVNLESVEHANTNLDLFFKKCKNTHR